MGGGGAETRQTKLYNPDALSSFSFSSSYLSTLDFYASGHGGRMSATEKKGETKNGICQMLQTGKNRNVELHF